jgi:hypothetical protein
VGNGRGQDSESAATVKVTDCFTNFPTKTT